MKRVSENPPPRFPARRIGEAQGPWWIAKVKPRQEKALAFDLITRGVEYYLPMYTKVVRRRDNNKPRKSVLPLFPGYLSFCAYAGAERLIFATNRIVNLVEVRHQKRFVNELEQIYFTLDLGMPLEPFARLEELSPGMMVEVRAGPLRGIRGTVKRMQGSHRLILSVDGLGRAALAVDASVVKPMMQPDTSDAF
jgi:transcriptional antiterminator RfaH